LKYSKQSCWPLERTLRARFCETLSCLQSSGPRYLSLKCPSSGNDWEVASRFTNTTYWRKQPRDSPKGRFLDYLLEEGTRSSIPTVMPLYWKTSANLYRLNHWSVPRGFDESKISIRRHSGIFEVGHVFWKLHSLLEHHRWTALTLNGEQKSRIKVFLMV